MLQQAISSSLSYYKRVFVRNTSVVLGTFQQAITSGDGLCTHARTTASVKHCLPIFLFPLFEISRNPFHRTIPNSRRSPKAKSKKSVSETVFLENCRGFRPRGLLFSSYFEPQLLL